MSSSIESELKSKDEGFNLISFIDVIGEWCFSSAVGVTTSELELEVDLPTRLLNG